MIISQLNITLSPVKDMDGPDDPIKGLEMINNRWSFTGSLYPREVRLMSALEALIKEFNRNAKP
jgi:hypothetical protein